MRKLTDKNLRAALKEGVKPLYYVAGSDEFLIDGCISSILCAAVGGDGEVWRFDTAKSAEQEIEQPFMTYSFGGAGRAILFDNCQFGSLSAARVKLLSGLIAEIPQGTTVVFKQFSDDDRFSIGKKTEQFIALCPDSALVEVSAKKGYELENYIAALIKRAGCTARDSVTKRMAELCGDDLMLISNEVNKLAAACDYGEITIAAVDELCVRTTEAGVYDMLSKIERGDTAGAMALLGAMLDDRTAPLMITAALNTAFINYYRARLAREQKKSEKQLFELFAYKKGDRKVSIAYERCTKFGLPQLEQAILILSELDLRLKSSVVDGRILLEAGVARLLCALRRRP